MAMCRGALESASDCTSPASSEKLVCTHLQRHLQESKDSLARCAAEMLDQMIAAHESVVPEMFVALEFGSAIRLMPLMYCRSEMFVAPRSTVKQPISFLIDSK